MATEQRGNSKKEGAIKSATELRKLGSLGYVIKCK